MKKTIQQRQPLYIILLIIILDLIVVSFFRDLFWLRIILAFIGLYAIIYSESGLTAKEALGTKPIPSIKFWFIIILCAVPCLLIFHFYFNKNTIPPTINWFVITCILASFVEESIYRFSVINILKKYMNNFFLITVSTLVFSLSHVLFGNFSIIHLIAGLFLGIIFVYSKSVIVTMIFHSLGNFAIGITFYL